jgi:hypothetical protein
MGNRMYKIMAAMNIIMTMITLIWREAALLRWMQLAFRTEGWRFESLH